MTEVFRTVRLLLQYRWLVFTRMLVHQLRHTVHGKFGVVASVIMSAILARISAKGFLESLPDSKAGLDGLILAAHVWLAVSLASMLLCQFAKAFLKNRDSEPLNAHPAFAPALASQRVIASIPLVTLTFVGLFYAYFRQPLAARLSNLWIAIPVHLLVTGILVVCSAVVTGSIGRVLLRNVARRASFSPDMIVRVVGIIAMTIFSVLLIGIIVVSKHAAGTFEQLGDSIVVSIPLGMVPFAAAVAADEGRWFAFAGWLGASIAGVLWAIRATYRWSYHAQREIPNDLATPNRRVFAPVFTGRPTLWLPAGVCAFWRKDIAVPYSRRPRSYLVFQVNLIWWSIMATILAMALRNRGTISAALADTIPVVMILLAMAVIAMQNGVNALGREGRELTWLRPRFTGPQLLGLKLFVNWAYVLIHSLTFAILVYAAAAATSLGITVWTLLLYAIGSGLVFACLATVTGFLLPDFERKRSSLSGSTTVGKGSYLLGSLILIGITGTAHLLLAAGVMGGALFAGMLTFGLSFAVVAVATIAAAAVKQYQGMEI